MHNLKTLQLVIVTTMLLSMIGCNQNENARLAQMAETNLQRQAEQNRRMADLQEEVAEGSRRLIEADAEARREIISAQQQLQAEQAQIGQQRDALEQERRKIALERHRDPIIAAAITGTGLLLACLLPLVLCWYLLRQPTEPADDAVVAEVLLADLVSNEPLLLAPHEPMKRLSDRTKPETSASGTDSGNPNATTDPSN